MLFYASCHCKAVQLEMEADSPLKAIRCNCSMCQKSGLLHLITPASKFRLLKGEDNLSCYTFNSHIAKHYFCTTCGIRPFYIPRSNPDGYSVNALCLDPYPENLEVEPFDGQNWEKHAHNLDHLSKDSSAGN